MRQPVAQIHAPVAADGTAVGLVIRGLEQPAQAQRRSDRLDATRHVPDKFLALNHARAEDEKGLHPVHTHIADLHHWLLRHDRLIAGWLAIPDVTRRDFMDKFTDFNVQNTTFLLNKVRAGLPAVAHALASADLT